MNFKTAAMKTFGKRKQPFYTKGDIKPTAYRLMDGVLCLWEYNPYAHRPIVIDWVKPGEIFGEEFALGQPAQWNAWNVRSHTWAMDVEIEPKEAGEYFVRRWNRIRDELMLQDVPHKYRIKFLYLLLNLPFPDAKVKDLLEGCGAVYSSKMPKILREQGLFDFSSIGKKILSVDKEKVLEQLKKDMIMARDYLGIRRYGHRQGWMSRWSPTTRRHSDRLYFAYMDSEATIQSLENKILGGELVKT